MYPHIANLHHSQLPSITLYLWLLTTYASMFLSLLVFLNHGHGGVVSYPYPSSGSNMRPYCWAVGLVQILAATVAHLPTWVQLSHHHLCPFHFVHSHLSSEKQYKEMINMKKQRR